jgi:hypothetical protein
VLLGLALTSDGFLWQDEYAHLQFSRWVWHHPSVSVDLWGRPLATLIYAVPALAGTWAARLLTVALATAAGVWTGKAARARGLSPMVAWACVLAQPVFFHFAFGALPGVLFAALLSRFLYDDARGATRHAAIVCALLPLARVEGVLVVALYALTLWRRGDRRLALVPFAGLFVWNLAGFAFTGDPLFLLTANPYPVFGSIYPTAGWAYLARILPAGAGVAITVLAIIGAIVAIRRRTLHLEHAIAAIVAVFFVCIWGFPMFASTPTPVYLIGFAPVLALLAAAGWPWLRAQTDTRTRLILAVAIAAAAVVMFPRAGPGIDALETPVGGNERIALGAAFLIVAVAFLVKNARWSGALLILAGLTQLAPIMQPVDRTPHEQAAAQAAAYYRAHYAGRALVAVAPDVAWDAHADPFIGWEPGALPTDPNANTALPANAVIAWDSEYSAREGATSLESLHATGWKDLQTFRAPGVEIRLLSR